MQVPGPTKTRFATTPANKAYARCSADWVARASRVLVSASRRDNLLKVRESGDAFANTRDACATRIHWCAGQRDFVSIGLFHHAGCKKENHQRASAHQKHGQKTTDRHNPLPITPEPIRLRHGRR